MHKRTRKNKKTVEKKESIVYNQKRGTMQYTPKGMKNAITVTEVYSLHYFKYCKRFDIEGESHDFWEFVYIDAGEVNAVAGDKTYQLKQGEAIFHKPGEFHNIHTEDRFANSIIISFSSKSKYMKFFEEKIITFSDYEKSLLRLIIAEASVAYPDTLNEVYAYSLGQSKSNSVGSDQIIRQNLELLLLSLLRRNDKSQREVVKTDTGEVVEENNRIVKQIKRFIDEHLYTEFTLSDMSRELFFSKTYLKSVFKKKMGTSINQYRITLKLDEAKRLISQRKYNFTEIAYRLGFASIHYFSRVFKAHTGMTPTEYQNVIGDKQILK